MSQTNSNLLDVDWSLIPEPIDDGKMAHVLNATVPGISLRSTDGSLVDVSKLLGTAVLFAYPRTGRPNEPSLTPEWDAIPGARGCTPQTCSYRDLFAELSSLNVNHVFGLSTQSTDYQLEMKERLHLPFEILSDESMQLTKAWNLPTFEVASQTLLKRFSLIIKNGIVKHVEYPIFPPSECASRVVSWLKQNP
jgi:peroxiredoxin